MNVKETHLIEGTPFVGLKTDDDKFMIALGNQIVSELEFDNFEDVKEYCNEKPWDLLTSVMVTMFNHLYETKKFENDDDNDNNEGEDFPDYSIL